MTARVIVVGSVNVDLVVSVARLPGPSETVTAGTFRRHHGGKGGNQAVAAARLGAATSLVAAVGSDEFGREARAALESERVELDHVVTVDDAPTGVALVMVASDGENQIAVASGANLRLTPALVRTALAASAPGAGDVVLVGHEIPSAAAREALRGAREAGATTVFNPAPADGLDRSVFGLADVLTPNRTELATLVARETERVGRPWPPPDDAVRAATSLIERNAEGEGAGAVLVSLGADGAVLVTRGSPPLDIPAPRVVAVDATGAGDALNGALAAGLAAGLDLPAAARRAVHAASRSTERHGAREGLPYEGELEPAR